MKDITKLKLKTLLGVSVIGWLSGRLFQMAFSDLHGQTPDEYLAYMIELIAGVMCVGFVLGIISLYRKGIAELEETERVINRDEDKERAKRQLSAFDYNPSGGGGASGFNPKKYSEPGTFLYTSDSKKMYVVTQQELLQISEYLAQKKSYKVVYCNVIKDSLIIHKKFPDGKLEGVKIPYDCNKTIWECIKAFDPNLYLPYCEYVASVNQKKSEYEIIDACMDTNANNLILTKHYKDGRADEEFRAHILPELSIEYNLKLYGEDLWLAFSEYQEKMKKKKNLTINYDGQTVKTGYNDWHSPIYPI